MRKKYFWHFIFLTFIIISLANLFQKLKWNSPTDNIEWKPTKGGLICVKSPKSSLIKKNDILITVNKFIITNLIDLNRTIRKTKICKYEIERKGMLKIFWVEISTKTTPLSYYILVFSGLLFVLLTLRILNIRLKHEKRFSPPSIFYLLCLSLSGFLIFSPTGTYNTTDFIFLSLDRLSFIFFPAILLHYSIYFPVKSRILRKIKSNYINIIIYSIPISILFLNLFFLVSNLINPLPENLIFVINNFRKISLNYFGLFLSISLIFFLDSNLKLIIQKKQKKLIFPLIGILISIPSILISIFLFPPHPDSSLFSNLSLFIIVFLPLSLTYFLSRRRFTDIENIIKKTVSISSIFLFIFGIYFFLEINIEKNIVLGIFWSIAAILTAGLLFRPIEETIQKNFEKIFFRLTYNFKKRLKELIKSIRTERDLSALSINFLNTINHGFQLQKSSLIIHSKKNIFYVLPAKNRITLSKNFQRDLFKSENLILFSLKEFERKYPKDFLTMKNLNCFQFLPLKTQKKLIGLVAFGLKKNKTYLSVEDWELMYNITPSLTLSVENAFLYSELENQFNKINLLKEFNENIIININLGIVVLSKLNIINTWNNFMELKFKIPKQNAINKKAFAVFGHKLWKKISQKKQGLSVLNNIEFDSELTFDIYLSPLKDNKGNVIGTILVFEDVTEKIFIQNQLITSEKMASLGLLSAGIAHEINTPLTGISSFCQFILDNPKSNENIELISRIQEQVQRANKIIRTLLDFSRQKGEQPAELNLNKIINESISLVEHKLKKKNIKLNREYNFENKLFGYSTRLQQLFINLLINASDATDDSNGIITIKGSETENKINIRIEDNGRGIQSQYIKKIFDPFFTTKDKGKGTGLGLSLSYNIVKDHFGDIRIDNNYKQGTALIITFPLKSPLRRIKI